jgi:hypothetical protein
MFWESWRSLLGKVMGIRDMLSFCLFFWVMGW